MNSSLKQRKDSIIKKKHPLTNFSTAEDVEPEIFFEESYDTRRSDKREKKEDSNPFKIPTDEEVFVMRDEEKKRRREERDQIAKMPVHQKTTWTTRIAVKRYKDGEQEEGITKLPPLSKNKTETQKLAATVFNKDNQNIQDFIDKKREMFLIQMSIDTKKFEIKKLEKKAEEREKKLEEEEAALKRDSQRFDEFLSENDIKAVEAANLATQESKLKKQKQDEIKALNQKKTSIHNDIAKLDEQLASCQRYKTFLDKLTPKDWRDMHGDAEEEDPAEKAAKEEKAGDENYTEQYPGMYFQKPEQLLNIFTDLEEENLKLIQDTHDTEEQLEDLKKKYRSTKEKMDKEAANLKEQIAMLNSQIEAEEKKVAEIRARAALHNDKESRDKLELYRKKISEIYKDAGFDLAANVHLKPLQMLAQIETKLEDLIAAIKKIKPEQAKKLENMQQKKRRKKLLDDRQNSTKQALEEKKKNRLEKQTQEVAKKHYGKPVMRRSTPVEKKKQQDETPAEREKNAQQDEFKMFFS